MAGRPKSKPARLARAGLARPPDAAAGYMRQTIFSNTLHFFLLQY